jgi:hypothetical protein
MSQPIEHAHAGTGVSAVGCVLLLAALAACPSARGAAAVHHFGLQSGQRLKSRSASRTSRGIVVGLKRRGS